MALLLRILTWLGSLVLRGAGVWLLLFAAHLLLTRAWPELRRTAQALEQTPVVQARLLQLEQALASQALSASQLEQQLSQLSESQLRTLQLRLAESEQRFTLLRDERTQLQAQLADLLRERDEYCASLNPFKRWMCRDLKQKLSALTERLAPLIAKLDADIEAAAQLTQRVTHQLELLRDPKTSHDQKVQLLGPEAGNLALALGAAQRDLQQVQQQAASVRAELTELQRLEASPSAWLLREWNAVKYSLLWVVLLLFVVPYAQRTLNYFVLFPLLTRWARGVRLSESQPGTKLEHHAAVRSLQLQLQPGESARFRSAYVRPVQGPTRSELLYQWRAPFISYAAGLTLLTRIDAQAQAVELTLSAPQDPHSYLMRVDLVQHPGVVVHPRNLVGLIGPIRLQTRWRLFSLHAWLTWQLRYILLAGTGSVVLEGCADVVATNPGNGATKIEQELVIGFDSRLAWLTARTEVFLPYLFGQTGLVDDSFSGVGTLFWQKSQRAVRGNVLARSFDAFWSALGKLLGF